MDKDNSSSEQGHFGHELPPDSQFSLDVSQMPENPPKNLGHRRAYSDILTLLDDIRFHKDLGVVGGLDEVDEDLISVYLDMDKFNPTSEDCAIQEVEQSTNVAPSSSEKPRIRHQHTQSMDLSTTLKHEMLIDGSEGPPLSELARVDPKRAKRIWANRQSASRSKERKMRYIADLERKIQTLQTEEMSLSAHFTVLQRDTNNLASENGELKMQLQSIEQQVHMQDALNDALREEIQHLKVLTGQAILNGGPPMSVPTSYGAKQQYYANNHALITAQQLQPLRLHSEKQQQHLFQQQQLHHFQHQQLQHR